MKPTNRISFFAAAGLIVLSTVPARGADIILNIVDPPNVGFNDPRPAAPVGGNAGTTLGEQRRIVFETAASIWEAALAPGVEIVIQSSFAPLACTATTGVLGAAGPIQIFANFPNAQWPNNWYHSALANHLAGEDLTPGGPDPGLLAPPFNDDIVAFFNGDIGTNPDCLTGFSWYNGLDNAANPATQFDLLNVVLHEFAHGLGFAEFGDNNKPGDAFLGLSDVYKAYSFDNELGLFWNQMGKQLRALSAVNDPNLVWRGPNVAAQAPTQLAGEAVVRINAPAGIARDLIGQTASFGALLDPPPGDRGEVVLFNDGVGPDPNDACGEDPNDVLDPNVAGRIALINRGTCTFAFKVAVAQLNGALGVIIANNVPTGLPGMGGFDLVPLTISAIGITQSDGNLIKANLPGVNASLAADPALGFAGADDEGFPKLYAPAAFAPGSSTSHWDVMLAPNKLMEPFINTDLKGASTLDLTPFLMQDIGWSGGPHCPVGADDRALVEVGDCATGITNAKGPYGFSLGIPRTIPELPAQLNGRANGIDIFGGCHVQDMVNACEKQGSSGQVSTCLTHVSDYLMRIGAISASERKAILACTK
jgi:PA domain